METPGYTFVDTSAGTWRRSSEGDGIEVMDLGEAEGQSLQLVRMQPNTSYPDHVHLDPEFVYMLEGSGRQAGKWLHRGWASVADRGSADIGFVSGDDGCVLLTVYGTSEPVD